MATERQIIANRANALKSTGPRSAEGKARSSRNAVRNGLRSSLPSFEVGQDPRFPSYRDALVSDLKPANAAEQLLVETMATSHICQMRLWALQTEALNSAVARQPLEAGSAATRCALAFCELAGHSITLETLLRCEMSF